MDSFFVWTLLCANCNTSRFMLHRGNGDGWDDTMQQQQCIMHIIFRFAGGSNWAKSLADNAFIRTLYRSRTGLGFSCFFFFAFGVIWFHMAVAIRSNGSLFLTFRNVFIL